MSTKKRGVVLTCFVFVVIGVFAQTNAIYNVDDLATSNLIKDLIRTDILNWLNDPVVVSAVQAANQENQNRTLDQIRAADQRWRAARGVDEFIEPYLNNETSDFLRTIQSKSSGLYAEIFIMDFQGVNVAQTDKTSDLWQGDEDKFTESYKDGEGAVHVGEVEFDESAQSYLIQVSLPIYDAIADDIIGAVTIGIDMSRL